MYEEQLFAIVTSRRFISLEPPLQRSASPKLAIQRRPGAAVGRGSPVMSRPYPDQARPRALLAFLTLVVCSEEAQMGPEDVSPVTPS